MDVHPNFPLEAPDMYGNTSERSSKLFYYLLTTQYSVPPGIHERERGAVPTCTETRRGAGRQQPERTVHIQGRHADQAAAVRAARQPGAGAEMGRRRLLLGVRDEVHADHAEAPLQARSK